MAAPNKILRLIFHVKINSIFFNNISVEEELAVCRPKHHNHKFDTPLMYRCCAIAKNILVSLVPHHALLFPFLTPNFIFSLQYEILMIFQYS